jgi:hypothetical protein
MTGNADIRLLGFPGFKASEHFLRALDEEICVSCWEETQVSADRPQDLSTDNAMRAALEQPSLITVVSAHAGYFDVDGSWRIGFCGHGDQPVVTIDSIGTLGATSMLLIDACHAPDLAAALKGHAQAGSLIVGLDAKPGKHQITRGRDSVTAIGAVIRELCYPPTPDLSPLGASRAVDLVNIQINARNDAEHDLRKARPPLLRKYE